MLVCANGLPMWLCQQCGWFWVRIDESIPARCAGCEAPDWDEPREDGPELPGA